MESGFADEESLLEIEKDIKRDVRNAKKEAWSEFLMPHLAHKKELVKVLRLLVESTNNKAAITSILNDLIAIEEPIKKDLAVKARLALRSLIGEETKEREILKNWFLNFMSKMQPMYSAHLYSEHEDKATNIPAIPPTYSKDAPLVDGRLIIRDNFDQLLEKYPEFLIFGEDSGAIGDCLLYTSPSPRD